MKDKNDREGAEESRAIVESIINEQMDKGIPAGNIILAGFSQGGAVSYYTALRSQHRIAGVLAMSTYLLFPEQAETEQSGVNQGVPIFASHGTQDGVVPLALGQNAAEKVKDLGYEVTWKTYAMEHEVNLEQIKDIGAWINTVFEKSVDKE